MKRNSLTGFSWSQRNITIVGKVMVRTVDVISLRMFRFLKIQWCYKFVPMGPVITGEASVRLVAGIFPGDIEAPSLTEL